MGKADNGQGAAVQAGKGNKILSGRALFYSFNWREKELSRKPRGRKATVAQIQPFRTYLGIRRGIESSFFELRSTLNQTWTAKQSCAPCAHQSATINVVICIHTQRSVQALLVRRKRSVLFLLALAQLESRLYTFAGQHILICKYCVTCRAECEMRFSLHCALIAHTM